MQLVDLDTIDRLLLDDKTDCFFSVKDNENTKKLYVTVYKIVGVNKHENAKRTISNVKAITDWEVTSEIKTIDKFVYNKPDWLKKDCVLTDGGTLFVGILDIVKHNITQEPIVIFDINGTVNKMEEYLFMATCKVNNLMYVGNADEETSDK